MIGNKIIFIFQHNNHPGTSSFQNQNVKGNETSSSSLNFEINFLFFLIFVPLEKNVKSLLNPFKLKLRKLDLNSCF